MGKYELNISALKVKNDKKIKPVKPNAKGEYVDLPAFVIGKGSRETDYVPESLYKCISDPNSVFYKRVQEANCEGEWGHPFICGTPEEQLRRLFFIDRTRISHVITNVRTVPMENGDYLGLITVKPTGEGTYGPALKASLEDPNINTSFSMRVFCKSAKMQPNGRLLKEAMSFITIDAEGTPGWEEASKRYRDGITISGGMESIGLHSSYCSGETLLSVIKEQKILGIESRNQQLFDLLKSDSVILENTSYVISPSNQSLMDLKGNMKSVFHTCFKK